MASVFEPVEYKVYKNAYKYIKIKKFNIIDDKTNIDNKQLDGQPNDLKQFSKTMQFHSYIRIKAENDLETLYVFIVGDPAFVSRVEKFKQLINTIAEKKCQLVMISANNVKNTILKYLGSNDKKSIKFRNLNFNYFKTDPRNHVLVPKHTLCDPEKVTQILSEYHLDDVSQFPQIKLSDPQVVWVDGDVGDVIEIERLDINTVTLMYRVVTL